jgi:hypothetical protein
VLKYKDAISSSTRALTVLPASVSQVRNSLADGKGMVLRDDRSWSEIVSSRE